MPYQLMPANEDAFVVFQHVRTDVVFSPSGKVLGLNKPALTAVLVGMEIQEKRKVFEKVSVLMAHVIKEELI